jgi:hypothetical protein
LLVLGDGSRKAISVVGLFRRESDEDNLDLQTIVIIVLPAVLVLAAIGGFVMQMQQLRKFRIENERLRREIATLREDVTHYQSLVSSVQFAPAARIEPVFRREGLQADITRNTEAGSQLEQRTGGGALSEPHSYASLNAPRRGPPQSAKRRLTRPPALLVGQAATVVIGALVMVVAAFGIFYLLSHERLIY